MQSGTNTSNDSFDALVQGLHLDGRYKILSKIGAGGMGEVYRARDLHMDRDVAIKILSQVERTPESTQRFFREAKVLASLSHPNIVKLYQFGIGEEFPYQVADLLEGRNLAERLQDGPLTIGEFNSIFIQIVDALDYASSQGLVHRDLKPANIFLCNTDDNIPRAVLLDFGIVRQLSAGTGAGAATLTSTQSVLGSPAYMSPEQCKGQAVDQRSDIYSLGCVFYECLTGNLPFVAETAVELLLKQMNDPPPAITTYVGSRSCKSALSRLVLQCLQKDPAMRPASFHDLKLLLNTALENTAETVRFTAPEKTSLRLSWQLSLSLILAVILPLGVGSIFFQQQQHAKEENAKTVSVELRRVASDRDPLRQQFKELEKEKKVALNRMDTDGCDRVAGSFKDLAENLKQQKRLEEAIESFDRALELAKHSSKSYSLQVDILIEMSNTYLAAWREPHKRGVERPECIESADRMINRALAEKKCSNRFRFKSLTKKCHIMMLKNHVEEAQRFLDQAVDFEPRVIRMGDSAWEAGCDTGKIWTKLSSEIDEGSKLNKFDHEDKVRIFEMQAKLAKRIAANDCSPDAAIKRAESWFSKAYPTSELTVLTGYKENRKTLMEILSSSSKSRSPEKVTEDGSGKSRSMPSGPASIEIN